MFTYSIANCEPQKLLGCFNKLSTLIHENEGVFVGAEKLAIRFVSEEKTFNFNAEDAREMHFGMSSLDPLFVFGHFYRGDLELGQLDSSYLKALCFATAKTLKKDGVSKIGGNKLFSYLAKAIGYKSHQAMCSVLDANEPIAPKFELVKFEDKGQDFHEFILVDGLIVDCQPHQGWLWIGSRGCLNDLQNSFQVYNQAHYASDLEFECLDFYEEASNINYRATRGTVSSEYQKGFLDGLAGKERESDAKEYGFGYSVAVYNLGKSTLLKDRMKPM